MPLPTLGDPFTTPLPTNPSTPAAWLIASLPSPPPPPPAPTPLPLPASYIRDWNHFSNILGELNLLASSQNRRISLSGTVNVPSIAPFYRDHTSILDTLRRLPSPPPPPPPSVPLPPPPPSSLSIYSEDELTSVIRSLMERDPSSPRLLSTSPDKFIFYFPPITFFDTLIFGPFHLHLSLTHLRNLSSSSRAYRPALSFSYPHPTNAPLPGYPDPHRSVPHPHINSSGSLCFGNLGGPIEDAVRTADLPTLVDLIWTWLTTYNTASPYFSSLLAIEPFDPSTSSNLALLSTLSALIPEDDLAHLLSQEPLDGTSIPPQQPPLAPPLNPATPGQAPRRPIVISGDPAPAPSVTLSDPNPDPLPPGQPPVHPDERVFADAVIDALRDAITHPTFRPNEASAFLRGSRNLITESPLPSPDFPSPNDPPGGPVVPPPAMDGRPPSSPLDLTF